MIKILTKNIVTATLLSTLLFSCQTQKKKSQSEQEEFNIEEQIVTEEGNFEVIQDESQAQQINEQVETVEVQDRVFYDFDSSKLDSKSKEILNLQAKWLNSSPNIKITIEGHTDVRGTREYNIALGEKRAVSAKDYLVSQGISPSRIKTISYGKEKPEFFGNSAEVHAKNRRSVVTVR